MCLRPQSGRRGLRCERRTAAWHASGLSGRGDLAAGRCRELSGAGGQFLRAETWLRSDPLFKRCGQRSYYPGAPDWIAHSAGGVAGRRCGAGHCSRMRPQRWVWPMWRTITCCTSEGTGDLGDLKLLRRSTRRAPPRWVPWAGSPTVLFGLFAHEDNRVQARCATSDRLQPRSGQKRWLARQTMGQPV
jgi:hypothetical protein